MMNLHISKLASIAPPRELICPITQEILRDPVLCSDGHTYERSSLVTWFSMGRNRSPVTNSLLEDTSIDRLVSNLAVSSMATLHREKLGGLLLTLCEGVKRRGGRCRDGGVRVEGLVDAGADVNVRGDGGNTPLHSVSITSLKFNMGSYVSLLTLLAPPAINHKQMQNQLIQSGNINLGIHLINHDANVTLTNDAGIDCIASAEEMLQKVQQGRTNVECQATVHEWRDFIEELKRKEALEKARTEARDRARNQANDE